MVSSITPSNSIYLYLLLYYLLYIILLEMIVYIIYNIFLFVLKKKNCIRPKNKNYVIRLLTGHRIKRKKTNHSIHILISKRSKPNNSISFSNILF